MNTNRRQLIKTLLFAPVAALAASVAIGRVKMEPKPATPPQGDQWAEEQILICNGGGVEVATVMMWRKRENQLLEERRTTND